MTHTQPKKGKFFEIHDLFLCRGPASLTKGPCKSFDFDIPLYVRRVSQKKYIFLVNPYKLPQEGGGDIYGIRKPYIFFKTHSPFRGGFTISSRGWQRYLQGVAKQIARYLLPLSVFCFPTQHITNLF